MIGRRLTMIAACLGAEEYGFATAPPGDGVNHLPLARWLVFSQESPFCRRGSSVLVPACRAAKMTKPVP